MDDVEPVQDVGAGEFAAEQQRRDPRARDRYRQRDGVGDAQTGAGELVVEERVAGEPVEDREDQQRHADHPVDLTRPAEGAREEDASEVHDDRGEEQQRGPVVDLAHRQAGAHVEAEVDGGLVGLAHLHALQRHVAAVVHDLGRTRMEEEREVHARHHEDDERVEREFADHERPVVGEHLVRARSGRSRRRRGAGRAIGRRASSPGRRRRVLVVDVVPVTGRGPRTRARPDRRSHRRR